MSLTDHMHPDELVSSAGALWRDGHVLMRGVLDGDSVSSLRPEFVQTVEQHRAEWPTKVLRAKKETVGGTQAQFDRIFGVRRKTGAGEPHAQLGFVKPDCSMSDYSSDTNTDSMPSSPRSVASQPSWILRAPRLRRRGSG